MCWLRRLVVALVALLLVGGALLSDISWRERRQAKARAERTAVTSVDMGVVLHVVVQDPNGDELVRGKPKLRILRTHRRGGMIAIDRDGVRWDGPTRCPVQWYCSEDAEPLILHGDDLPDSLLVYGSEGAGKTTAQAMWCLFRVLERIGQGYTGEIGMTAPTSERAGFIKEAIERTWSPTWMRWNERHQTFNLHAGISIKLRSTKRQSEASGSPVQGYNWSDAGSDEIQDSLDADSDIESRLRDAPGGRGKRFATATAKDSPDFRTWRDRQLGAATNGRAVWLKADMLAARSPFMTADFIERKKSTMTLREFERRYGAKDLGPERQVYHTWSRKDGDFRDSDGNVVMRDGMPVKRMGNVRPLPHIGTVDVTARELGAFGRNVALLAGHDPGKRKDVTLFLRAFEFAGRDTRPRWFVVDEVTTTGATHETHVKQVLALAVAKYGCYPTDRLGRRVADGPSMLVRADPHTRSGSEHPGQDLYAIWANHGVAIKAAAYKPQSTQPYGVKPESRIDLINSLLCDGTGVSRLFVALDAQGQPCAPRLVEAIESMERDLNGTAEHERKDDTDKSHWPAALGYALWSLERPRMGGERQA